jgi:hypothetical protein
VSVAGAGGAVAGTVLRSIGTNCRRSSPHRTLAGRLASSLLHCLSSPRYETLRRFCVLDDGSRRVGGGRSRLLLVSVYANPGIRTLDLRYWTFTPAHGQTTYWPEVGVGWNVTSRWYSEVLASYIGSDQTPTTLSTWNWQNDVLLTQGQYPFDLAIHTLYSRARDPVDGATLERRPRVPDRVRPHAVQSQRLRPARPRRAGFGADRIRYQWQVRQHWLPLLNVGVQGFGELDVWDRGTSRDGSSNRAGPAIFAHLRLGPGDLGWQAAYLFGKTYGRNGDMFTMRVKYEF